MKKILSFDLDNTLLDDNTMEIPLSAIQAIDAVREKYHIVLATGRDLTIKNFKCFLDVINPDAYVHCNGAQVHINGKCVYSHSISRKLLINILDYVSEKNMCICGVVNGIQYTNLPNKLIPLKRLLSAGAEFRICDIYGILDSDVKTLGLAAVEKEVMCFLDKFPQLKCPAVIPNVWYDVMERSVSKTAGMLKVLRHFKLTMDDVIAFGDSMNDYELISKAGYGVVMGNGDPELKKIADFITSNIEKDGVSNAIKAICY